MRDKKPLPYLETQQALLGTEFAALLARADVSQAVFARLTGYTTRQQLVSDTLRRAALGGGSQGSASIAGGKLPEPLAILQDASPEAIQILLVEVSFSWHETLGVPPMPAQFAAPGLGSPTPPS
jgi:hypothetical protein